jgi:hypothetical protein
MEELDVVFCKKCGYKNISTNSPNCPSCKTVDFLPSQEEIVEFQTRVLLPCRNEKCTNETNFSLILNQSVDEDENCKKCGEPWENSKTSNLEQIQKQVKSDRFTWQFLTEEGHEWVEKWNQYSIFKTGKPEFVRWDSRIMPLWLKITSVIVGSIIFFFIFLYQEDPEGPEEFLTWIKDLLDNFLSQ